MTLSRKRKPHAHQVIGRQECPRCNAEARIVVERDKPKTPGWEMYVQCPKCKAKTFVGWISEQYKRRIDRNYVLMKKWEKAKTPRERGRIMVEIRKLGKEEDEWEKNL